MDEVPKAKLTSRPVFDQTEQSVVNQYNAAGDIHIHEARRIDASTSLTSGMQLLRAHAFAQAASAFRTALDADPSMRMASYGLVLALLKGQRPKILSRSEVTEIDDCLCAHLAYDEADGLFHWLRAIIREDYYVANGMVPPPPSVDALVSSAATCRTDRAELAQLLQDVNLRGNRVEALLRRSLSVGSRDVISHDR